MIRKWKVLPLSCPEFTTSPRCCVSLFCDTGTTLTEDCGRRLRFAKIDTYSLMHSLFYFVWSRLLVAKQRNPFKLEMRELLKNSHQKVRQNQSRNHLSASLGAQIPFIYVFPSISALLFSFMLDLYSSMPVPKCCRVNPLPTCPSSTLHLCLWVQRIE